MDKKTVFVKTGKGEIEVKGKGGRLSGDLKRALFLVDDTSTFDEISRRSAPSLRGLLPDVFGQLVADGYIRDKAKPFAEAQIAVPKAAPATNTSDGELDFTSLPSASSQRVREPDHGSLHVQAADQSTALEAQRSHSEVEAAVEAAKNKARAEAEAKTQANLKQAAEIEARNRVEAEARAKQEALLRAQAEAKAKIEIEARLFAEQAAAQAKMQLEVAAKAKAEAELRAKQELEAIQLKAALEAARAKAELEAAARARAEAEAAKAKAEAEAKALAQERVKQEIEAARIKAEQEASRIRAEQEVAKAKAEAVARAFAEEKRIKAEQEADRIRAEIKAEQESARLKAEAESRALADEKAKHDAEDARIRAEQETARIKAELETAKAKAEAEAKALAEERIKQEALRIKAEQEAVRIKAELEAAKAKAEAEARALTEQRARQEAENTRINAAQEAARNKRAQETASAQAAADTEARSLAAIRARQEAEIARINAEQESARVMAESVKWALSQPDTSEHSIEFHQKVNDARLEAERVLLEHKIAEQEAAMLKANEDSQKLADEQAKAWAAAEQRANALARSEALRSHETVEHAKGAVQQTVRVRRKPLPAGKITAGLFVVLFLSMWLVPYVFPFVNYIAPVEKILSDQFKQPVHVGVLRAEIFPWPKIQLDKVAIGSEQEIKIGEILLKFDPFTLFSSVKNIRAVELQNLVLDGSSLENESLWLQEIGANPGYKISHVTLPHFKISSTEITLPEISGDIEITSQGRIGKATIKSEDGKFDLTFQSEQERWQLSMNAKNPALPMLSNIKLDDISASGDISAAGANFTNIDVQAYGGFLHGNAKLTWQNGWILQGRIGAKSVELDKLFPKFGISGELQGDCNFSLSGNKLALISDSPQMDGSFSINKGVVSNMDIVETVRQGNRQVGRTHFDELTGNIQINGRGPHFQLQRMTSGILSGSGSFDVGAASQLSGRFSVELKAREGATPLSLSGTLTEPVLGLGR